MDGKDFLVRGYYRRRSDAIFKCFAAAARRGYRAFSVQHQGWCATGPRAHLTYRKYGRSNRCRNGKGGPWANDVYFIRGESTGIVAHDLSVLDLTWLNLIWVKLRYIILHVMNWLSRFKTYQICVTWHNVTSTVTWRHRLTRLYRWKCVTWQNVTLIWLDMLWHGATWCDNRLTHFYLIWN